MYIYYDQALLTGPLVDEAMRLLCRLVEPLDMPPCSRGQAGEDSGNDPSCHATRGATQRVAPARHFKGAFNAPLQARFYMSTCPI